VGVEKGSDVAVVVIERGRQWGRRRGGRSCAVTWQSRVVSCRRAHPRGGPNAGIDRGAQQQPWRPRVVVVVVRAEMGRSRCVTRSSLQSPTYSRWNPPESG